LVPNTPQVPYKYVDDLATVWCEWAEMELRHNNFKAALELMRRATAAPQRPKKLSQQEERLLPVQERLYRSGGAPRGEGGEEEAPQGRMIIIIMIYMIIMVDYDCDIDYNVLMMISKCGTVAWRGREMSGVAGRVCHSVLLTADLMFAAGMDTPLLNGTPHVHV